MELFDIFPSAVYREMYEDHVSLKKIVIPMVDNKPLETNGMSEKLFHLIIKAVNLFCIEMVWNHSENG